MPSIARKSFAIRVRALRAQHQLTQEELSHRIGISTQTISMIENARQDACLDVLVKLASGFHLTLSQLMEGVEYRSHQPGA